MADNTLYNAAGYDQKQAWDDQSRQILASMLTDYGTILTAVKYPEDFISPTYRKLYTHIIEQFQASQSIATLTSIENELGPEHALLAKDLKSRFNPDFNSVFDFSMDSQGTFGARAQLAQLGQDLTKVSGNIDDVLEDVEDRIRQVKQTTVRFRPGDAATVLGEAAALAEILPQKIIKTKIPWLDFTLNGGCMPGMNYWVSGSYKSGKTTFARNLALNILEQGKAVTFVMAESSRDMLIFDFLAMMLNKELIAKQSNYKPKFSGIKLFNAVGTYGKKDKASFTALEFDTYKEVFNRLKSYPLYLWDTRDGVTNLSKFGSLITQVVEETDCRVFIADHSQLFGNPSDTMFERQSKTSRFVQDVAIQQQISFWMLTQLNEESLKGKNKNSDSIGVRGGGDASAAAEVMLKCKLDDETNTIQVDVAHSRRSGKGSYTNLIDLQSGLFLDVSFKNEPEPELDLGPEIEIDFNDLADNFVNDFTDTNPFG